MIASFKLITFVFNPELLTRISNTINSLAYTFAERILNVANRYIPKEHVKELEPRYLVRNWSRRRFDLQIRQIEILEACPENPITTQMISLCRSSPQCLLIYNQTDQNNCLIPTFQALEMKAKHYQNKYNIEIHISTISKLKEKCLSLLEFQSKQSEPRYLAIIVCKDSPEQFHAVPCLLYFGEENEVLVLDCIRSDQTKCVALDTEASSIFSSIGLTCPYNIIHTPRQADVWSCRTGAITFCRNALLDIRFNNYENGYGWALTKKIGSEDSFELPITWTYTEQIFNAVPEINSFNVIRRYYSKKPEKRQNPETIAAFRAKNMGEIQFLYQLEGQSELSFEVSKQANRYLVYKAKRDSTVRT